MSVYSYSSALAYLISLITEIEMSYRPAYKPGIYFAKFHAARKAPNDNLVKHNCRQADVQFPSALLRELQDNKICKYIFMNPA